MDLRRFWNHVLIGAPDDCWEWQSGRFTTGYGVVNLPNGHQAHASRVAYILTNGDIPDALKVCHKCDNPPCCNPAHLFTGTQAENLADMRRKGRQGKPGYKPGMQVGEKNNSSKLSWEKVAQIRRLLAEGQTYKEVAEAFGVSRPLISLINTNKLWRDQP